MSTWFRNTLHGQSQSTVVGCVT